MAGELKHKDAGAQLTQTEDNAIDRHEATGQTLNDIFYFDGTSWVRTTLADYLASQKIIALPNDGYIKLGTLAGSPKLYGGESGSPYEAFIQPSEGDNVGELAILPSGSETDSSIVIWNTSDYDNGGYLQVYLQNLTCRVVADKHGTGTAPTSYNFELPMKVKKFFGFGAPQTLVLSTDVGAMTQSFIQLQAQTSTTDDCTQLTGGSIGDLIIVMALSGHTITMKDGANMLIGGDVVLVGNNGDLLMLLNLGADTHRKLAPFGDN